MITLSLAGNSIVLFASVKYKALNMCRISCLLLENLAVADLFFAVIGGLPMYVTFCARRWVLGEFACIVNGFFTSVFGTAEILILAVISLYRAALLKNPFLLRGVSDKKLYLGVGLIWFMALVPAITFILADSFVYYDPNMMSCTVSIYTDDHFYVLVMVYIGLYVVAPMCTIIVNNVIMLVVSVRYKRRLSKTSSAIDSMSALGTVMAICWLFVLSWLPYVARVVCAASEVFIPRWFYILQVHFLALNVVLNPVIYSITNRSFKEVVADKVFGRLGNVVCCRNRGGNVVCRNRGTREVDSGKKTGSTAA